MDKRKIVGLLIGVVLGVGIYFLLANSHADFFSATSTLNTSGEYCDDPQFRGIARDTISLAYLEDGYDQCYTYSLTAMGWITAILVIGVVPLVLGLLLGRLIIKKK